jgi:hypothetical protein
VAGTDAKHQADDIAKPSPRRSRWWIAVLTFVAGIAVGVLFVGLLDTTTPQFSAVQSAPPATPSPTETQGVPGGGGARVNAACLRVIKGAQDINTILSEVGPAITAVNLQQLDDIVRRLQSLQTGLENDLRDCKVDTVVSNTQPAQPPASPTPEPASALSPSAGPTR